MIKFAPSSPAATTAAATKETKPFTMVMGKNDRMAGSVPVWSSASSFAENIADAGGEKSAEAGKDKSFGFSDLVDIVNPLQHIPVVSNLYQAATGDTMGAIAQIVGGAIFGGPIGALAGVGMAAYHAAKESEAQGGNTDFLSGTTIALADMRKGYTPYNV